MSSISKSEITRASTSKESIGDVPCAICRRQFSRYTCPNCNIPYCSLVCFRGQAHGECSESFYKKEIQSEIQGNTSKTAQERNKMMQMLKKFEEEADQDEEELRREVEGTDLASRMEELDIDSASYDELWSALTPEEREKFLKLIQDPSNELTEQLLWSEELQKEIVYPWWERPENLLENANDSEDDKDDEGEHSLGEEEIRNATKPRKTRFGKRPKMMEIPPSMVKATSSGIPSEAAARSPLLYNICAVIIVYAYITRTLSASPLSVLDPSSPEYIEAKRLFALLVPFLIDKKSKHLFISLDSVVTDLWSRFENDSMSASLLSTLLQDLTILVQPSSISILPPPQRSEIDLSEQSLPSHPNFKTLLALSDISSLFGNTSGSPQTKPNHVVHKLTFYVTRILASPAPFMRALVQEIEIRKNIISMEVEREDEEVSVNVNDSEQHLEVGGMLNRIGVGIEELN